MIPIGVTGAEDFVIWNKRKMKLNQTLMDEIACALDMRKKNGDPVWDDDTEVQVQIAGTFAADKFIVLKKVTPKEESNPNPELKGHHSV